jgi:hypothetical protein
MQFLAVPEPHFTAVATEHSRNHLENYGKKRLPSFQSLLKRKISSATSGI